MVFRQGSCEGQDMAPLPPRDQRHPWLRYQVEGYTEDIMHNYEQRLKTIFGRMSDTEMGLDVADTLCFSEMAEDGFEAYWLGSERVIPDKGAPEKVTDIDLFYLRSMDRGTANVPYLLAQYLFRYAEGRKIRARLFGGHFIRRLAAHFGLVRDEGLRGLLAWVAPGLERQPNAAAGAPKAVGEAPAIDEGASADPEPI
ncbi:hypothetical protein Tco_1297528 [Tanacetum coccineum]